MAVDAIPRQIEACEALRYHLSQYIQAHGVLFALEYDTRDTCGSFRIVRHSANASAILGRDVAALAGSDFRDLLTPASAAQLQVAADTFSTARHSLVLTFADPAAFVADAFLFHAGSLLCIEFEPPPACVTAIEAIEALSSRFFDLTDRITHAEVPSTDLPGIVCAAMRDVTGFDRIYYCLFDQYDHGHVLGEICNKSLPELIDHHFPATDIPQAARRMFVSNPYRLIPDIDAIPVELLGGGPPLDLTMSTCRAVAVSHLQYIRNMGVQASLSFPVVRDGRMEAIFGGHHKTARQLSFRQMATCRHLVELFKSRMDFLRLREERVLLAERIEVLYSLCARFQAAGPDLGAFIAVNHDAFCSLMEADDLVCRFEGQSYVGSSVGRQDGVRLLAYFSARLARDGGVYLTDRLGHENSGCEPMCPAVAGACAVSLDLHGNNIIAWLRREIVVVEKWSGNPSQPAVIDGSGVVGPRTSFLAYRREVKGTSRLWPSVSVDLVRQLRHAFAQVLTGHYEIGMRRAAEQSNALKSQFVANITHELRSPMHAIIGFADLLAAAGDGLPVEKRKRYAGVIQESGRRLLRLINDLLDLSQLEAGKMAFTFTNGDMLPVIEAAIAEVSGIAQAKSIRLTVHDRRRTRHGRFDPVRMGQVIINLLSNALKFSPSGSDVTVSMDTTEPGPGGVRLVIEVADQGFGIPDGELESVFGKFIQSTRTRNGAGGTGLGLAICRDIIEAHCGRIWAASNPARGTSFFVNMPLYPDSAEGTEA